MVTKLFKVSVPLVAVINNIIMQSVLHILLKYLLNLADFLLSVAIFDYYYIYALGAGNLFPGTNRLVSMFTG